MDDLLGFVDVRLVEGRELFLFMYWYGFVDNRVSRSSRHEKDILNELLLKVLATKTVQDLKREGQNQSSTIVSWHRDHTYRIDSQTVYNYDIRDIANLQYQFKSKKTNRQDSYAVTVIKYKPSEVVPANLLKGRGVVEIDDEVYGFTDEDILTLFQVAMQNSAEHQKTNRIHWVIISLEGKIKSKDALWPYRSKIAIQELRRLSQAPRNYISNNFIQQVEEMFKKGENSTDPNIIFPMPVRLLKYSALRKSPTIGAETFLKEITFDSHDLLTVGLPRVAEIRFRKRDYFGALVEAAATGFSVDISFCGATIFFIIKTGLLCRDFAYCSMDNVSQKSELRGAVE